MWLLIIGFIGLQRITLNTHTYIYIYIYTSLLRAYVVGMSTRCWSSRRRHRDRDYNPEKTIWMQDVSITEKNIYPDRSQLHHHSRLTSAPDHWASAQTVSYRVEFYSRPCGCCYIKSASWLTVHLHLHNKSAQCKYNHTRVCLLLMRSIKQKMYKWLKWTFTMSDTAILCWQYHIQGGTE